MNSGILLQLKKSLNFSAAGFEAVLPAAPQRIISLVPSQTELLHYLGLDEGVAGITKFCIHPNTWFLRKTRIGGTKNPDIEKIKTMQPDLIIANKEENRKEDIEQLAEHFPVYVSDISTLEEALQMIADTGQITGTSARAEELVTGIRNNFSLLQPVQPEINAAYLVWQQPFMAAGGDTFINDMMQRCGLKNIFGGTERYPETTLEQLKEKDCRLLLLSSEPFPFNEKHLAELNTALPGTKVLLADGEMFSWYGSRLLLSPGYFGNLITEFLAV